MNSENQIKEQEMFKEELLSLRNEKVSSLK